MSKVFIVLSAFLLAGCMQATTTSSIQPTAMSNSQAISAQKKPVFLYSDLEERRRLFNTKDIGTGLALLGAMLVQDTVMGTGSVFSPIVHGVGSISSAVVGGDERPKPVHGNWCGLNYPDAKTYNERTKLDKSQFPYVLRVPKEMAPIDIVDYHCALHDVCYDSQELLAGSQLGSRIMACDLSMNCAVRSFMGVLTPAESAVAGMVVGWAGYAVVRRNGQRMVNRCVVRDYDEIPVKVQLL